MSKYYFITYKQENNKKVNDVINMHPIEYISFYKKMYGKKIVILFYERIKVHDYQLGMRLFE